MARDHNDNLKAVASVASFEHEEDEDNLNAGSTQEETMVVSNECHAQVQYETEETHFMMDWSGEETSQLERSPSIDLLKDEILQTEDQGHDAQRRE